MMRSHTHSDRPSRMPNWLHHALYRQSPYQYVRVDPTSPVSPLADEEGSRWYYKTKQRKLMKMQVDDAFEIRGSVQTALAVLVLLVAWTAWRATCWTWKAIFTRGG